MAWTYLFFAGLFEIGWAIGLKYTEGFTKLTPTILTVIAGRHSLCGLDRHRHGRNSAARHLASGRTGNRRATELHRTDRRRHHRPQGGRLTEAGHPPWIFAV